MKNEIKILVIALIVFFVPVILLAQPLPSDPIINGGASDNPAGGGGGGDPLAVGLSTFTAVYSNGSSLLQWSTQSESNNLGWNVYRNTSEDFSDGLKVNIEIIEGAGTTSEQTDYTFSDQISAQENTTFYYWLESVEYSGNTELFGPISINIEYQPDNPTPPTAIITGLHQNYPNPFNPETEIQFALEEPGNAELIIYNIKGQKVVTLYNENTSANEYITVKWNGSDHKQNKVSSGIYMYKLKTANNEYMKKMILMK